MSLQIEFWDVCKIERYILMWDGRLRLGNVQRHRYPLSEFSDCLPSIIHMSSKAEALKVIISSTSELNQNLVRTFERSNLKFSRYVSFLSLWEMYYIWWGASHNLFGVPDIQKCNLTFSLVYPLWSDEG